MQGGLALATAEHLAGSDQPTMFSLLTCSSKRQRWTRADQVRTASADRRRDDAMYNRIFADAVTGNQILHQTCRFGPQHVIYDTILHRIV